MFKIHKGVTHHVIELDKYIATGVESGALLGLFDYNLFKSEMAICPLNTTEKNYLEECRIIFDFKFSSLQNLVILFLAPLMI